MVQITNFYLLMMFLVAFFDGMDTAVMGFIAPDLIRDWGIEKSDIIPC